MSSLSVSLQFKHWLFMRADALWVNKQAIPWQEFKKTDIIWGFSLRQTQRDRGAGMHRHTPPPPTPPCAFICTCTFRCMRKISILFAGANFFHIEAYNSGNFAHFTRVEKSFDFMVNVSWNKDQMFALAPVWLCLTFPAGVINYTFYSPTATLNSKRLNGLISTV